MFVVADETVPAAHVMNSTQNYPNVYEQVLIYLYTQN